MPPQQNDELPGVRRFTEVDDRLSGNLNLLDRFILHFVASTDVQILCCESTLNSSRHNEPYRAWYLRTFGKRVCFLSGSEGRIGEDGRGAAATRLLSCHVKNAGILLALPSVCAVWRKMQLMPGHVQVLQRRCAHREQARCVIFGVTRH